MDPFISRIFITDTEKLVETPKRKAVDMKNSKNIQKSASTEPSNKPTMKNRLANKASDNLQLKSGNNEGKRKTSDVGEFCNVQINFLISFIS